MPAPRCPPPPLPQDGSPSARGRAPGPDRWRENYQCRTPRLPKLAEECSRGRLEVVFEQHANRHQRVVKLVGVPWIRPFFVANPIDGRLVQGAKIARRRDVAGAT